VDVAYTWPMLTLRYALPSPLLLRTIYEPSTNLPSFYCLVCPFLLPCCDIPTLSLRYSITKEHLRSTQSLKSLMSMSRMNMLIRYLLLLYTCKSRFISGLYNIYLYLSSTKPLLFFYRSSIRQQEAVALVSFKRIEIPIKGQNYSHLGNKSFPAWE
jgi:hypothetical protein